MKKTRYSDEQICGSFGKRTKTRYLLGDPYAWPEMVLFGVALSNTGTAVVYIFNRRCCD